MPTTRALMKNRLVMWAGLLINDILSWNRNAALVPSRRIPHRRTISRRVLLEILPALRDTAATGAGNYVRADSFLLDAV